VSIYANLGGTAEVESFVLFMDEGLFFIYQELTKIRRIGHSSEVVNNAASKMMNSFEDDEQLHKKWCNKKLFIWRDYNDN
jgi:hypothetical protein